VSQSARSGTHYRLGVGFARSTGVSTLSYLP
jgi:hypothetical protein